ncbi:hypothetical protein FisN_8Hh026 [Fistulifera solaris]|jgi:hypothetical protein|uniref:Peptide-O-fucosyltransferase n=1 Tax=Fistulifera solaris TaxID=1519565 RepID=A0A1Z5JJE8_FISSO|nr:hypothetical protein FisN_8Hh026 [Fistulifera solaris]|eukprot:GAX14135.1 hypothetical protein FisN_8Hh026 [Fistulifera solaris]
MHRLDVTLSSSSNHVLSYFLREAKHPIQQSPNSTLALLSPPGLLGGYRNQVLRWMAFVLYAKQHELEQIFLPSILWSTQIVTSTNNVSKWYPIPMEWVFDVEFWNQFHPQLPLLISEPLHNSDCWEMPRTIVNITLNPLQQAALERGYLHPLKNIATQQLKEFNPRKQDFLPLVQHCQHPVVYGGGIQAGRLWNDYLEYTKKKSTLRKELSQIDEWVYRALRPAPQWRAVAQQCVPTPHYAVLHARLEMDMMAHVCGIDMERNLTQILQQVATVLETNYSQVTGLVIAVSRAGMMAPKQSSERQAHAQHNLKTLNRLVREGWRVGSRQVQVLECGERLVQEYYEAHPDIVDHGSLLHSVVNFDLALNADVFIGVRSSSYSTDVLTSRYYMGKGDHNYRYTKTDHIEKVKGLPEPHANCARKKKTGKL